MKIAIITFSCAFNYGAVLQTYGLYNYLEKKENEVTVIDYIPDRYDLDSDNYADMAIKRTRLWKYIPFSKVFWKKTRLKQFKTNRDVFRSFLEKNVVLTHKYFSLEELEKDIPEADIYITGSDQVWNPDFVWNSGIDKPYYLAFLPESAHRISYASSFGKNKLSETESTEMKNYLEKYDMISVREKSGTEIIKQMGLYAEEVADPTVLAGADTFSVLAKKPDRISKPYVLLFQITFDQKLYGVCKELAEKNGMKLITLIPDALQSIKCNSADKVVLPSVEEWIGYFLNAEYVVTDSFHATVFSIMFEKPFSSFALAGYNGRIYNILKKVGLENRILSKADYALLAEQFGSDIEFDSVKRKFMLWQANSRDWLDKAVENLK